VCKKNGNVLKHLCTKMFTAGGEEGVTRDWGGGGGGGGKKAHGLSARGGVGGFQGLFV